MAEKLLMTALSPTMEEGTIVSWKAAEGDAVKEGDILCEVETDKATMDYESPVSGIMLKIIAPAGSKLRVGDPIAVIGEKGEDISALLAGLAAEAKSTVPAGAMRAAAPGVTAAPAVETMPGSGGRVRASPLARALAAEKSIDISLLKGTGPGGRVIREDVDRASREGVTVRAPVGETMRLAAVAPIPVGELRDEVIPVSSKRRIIAERVGASKLEAPHYYLTVRVLMDRIIASRNELNRRLKDANVSMNAFLIKLAAEAIRRHPVVNSTWQGDTIMKHGRIDVGLAVAQRDGLITPVVRDCGNRGILQINADLSVLIRKALDNKLTQEDYTGATFTISNLGSFGIDEFTAIINPPGSAILAVGKSQKEPVVEADEIVVRSRMTMTLSCDHRVIDGAVGAAFLADLKAIMEDPVQALY